MGTHLVFLLFPLILAFSHAEFDDDWDASATCQSGRQQSPLDIVSAAAVYDEAKGAVEFNWEHSGTLKELTVSNDGYTVYSTGKDFSENIELDGEKYVMHRFNSYWGAAGEKGSMHAFDGAKFDGEIEALHLKAGLTDLRTALSTPGNVVSVSILMEIDPSMAFDVEPTNDFENGLSQIIPVGKSYTMPYSRATINLKELIPADEKFYRYKGSLVSSPCTEGIERIVLKNPLKVTASLFEKYQKLNAKGGGKMTSSLDRPLQPLNGRRVYKNFQ